MGSGSTPPDDGAPAGASDGSVAGGGPRKRVVGTSEVQLPRSSPAVAARSTARRAPAWRTMLAYALLAAAAAALLWLHRMAASRAQQVVVPLTGFAALLPLMRPSPARSHVVRQLRPRSQPKHVAWPLRPTSAPPSHSAVSSDAANGGAGGAGWGTAKLRSVIAEGLSAEEAGAYDVWSAAVLDEDTSPRCLVGTTGATKMPDILGLQFHGNVAAFPPKI
jgi:hypothetical protein